MSARRIARQAASEGRSSKTHGDDLQRALNWIFNEGSFSNLRVHGNVSWSALDLVRLAIFWVWSADSSMVKAVEGAVSLVRRIFGQAAVTSYQGLTGALKAYSDQLLPVLWCRLHSLMEQTSPEKYRVGMWLALAMDGSRISVPRTKQNEKGLSKPPQCKKRKTKKTKRSRHAGRKRSTIRTKSHYDPQSVGPQMWLTMIWHIGLNLPWCWKTGPSYASERGHELELLAEQEFPKNTLFCGDAGFTGYDFWRKIQAHGHHFLVRVGANVRLLKRLGYVRERRGIVYCWPDTASKKMLPPLVLRLMRFNDGRGDVYLVTNVLDEKRLTEAQAREIYRRRWGIEVQFRSFKQTFDRSKLRSGTPDCAEVELNWSLLGLWMIQLLALKERTKVGEPDDKTSVAAAIRIIREMMNKDCVVRPSSESLTNQLAQATTDNYVRKSRKQNRNYPRRKEEPSTGKPIILLASAKQKQKLIQNQELANALQNP